MSKHISSKKAVVSRPPHELYMGFTDMRNFVQFLPPDKREGVEADFDTVRGTVQGFNIGVRVSSRTPYSRLDFESTESPVAFSLSAFFDPAGTPGATEFHIELDLDVNMMMGMMIGGKLQDALDRMVGMLADASNGKFPEGFNPEDYMKNPL